MSGGKGKYPVQNISKIKPMTVAQLNRLNKALSEEEKALKAWKKAQEKLAKARKKW